MLVFWRYPDNPRGIETNPLRNHRKLRVSLRRAQDNRFYLIDLLRFLAALVVLLFHYTFRGAAADKVDVAFPTLGAVFKYGFFGVDLFFIISGFVILRSAFGRNAREFVVSRVTRLFPGYWVCVTLTFVFILFLGGDRFSASFPQYVVNLTMLQEFVRVDSLDGVYWTLAVELKFYFLVLLLVTFRQVQRLQHFLVAWLAASILLDTLGGPTLLQFLLFPTYSYLFIAGATFLLVRLHGCSAPRLALLAGSYAGSIYHALRNMELVQRELAATFDPVVVILIITVCFSVFFLIALGKTALLDRPGFVAWGALTYPLYLLHENIGFMLFNALDSHVPAYLLLITVAALMLAASYVVHRFVERRYAPSLKQVLERALRLASTKGARVSS